MAKTFKFDCWTLVGGLLVLYVLYRLYGHEHFGGSLLSGPSFNRAMTVPFGVNVGSKIRTQGFKPMPINVDKVDELMKRTSLRDYFA